MTREYYTFSGEYEFRRIAKRYGTDINKILPLIIDYVRNRHDEYFTICLRTHVGSFEPFIKNELKPTIRELCVLYDSAHFSIEIDDNGKIRLYAI